MTPAHSSAALAVSEPHADPALSILRSVFGYPSFRGQQAEIIAHVIAGHDALVLMPTGGGKWLCFPGPGARSTGRRSAIRAIVASVRQCRRAQARRPARRPRVTGH